MIGSSGDIGSVILGKLEYRAGQIYALHSSSDGFNYSDRMASLPIDFLGEKSIADAAKQIVELLDLVIVTTDIFHEGEALRPGKSFRDFEFGDFLGVFAINATS